MKKALFLFAAGMITVLIGALLKIQHAPLNSSWFFIAGMFMEVLASFLILRRLHTKVLNRAILLFTVGIATSLTGVFLKLQHVPINTNWFSIAGMCLEVSAVILIIPRLRAKN